MTMVDWTSQCGVLFDLDGVITPTASLHRNAWGSTFAHLGFTDEDYLRHVDGRPRYDGVAAFLASRSVSLPWGDPTDPPGDGSICAIGNEKDRQFNALLDSGDLVPYPGSLRLLDHLDAIGVTYGLVTSSRNASRVLSVTGLTERFRCVVDGNHAEAAALAGKPAPDTYLAGASLLGCTSERCIVVEDATSGIAAGTSGGFGIVIGVDRGGNRSALYAAGANLVVDDLLETVP